MSKWMMNKSGPKRMGGLAKAYYKQMTAGEFK